LLKVDFLNVSRTLEMRAPLRGSKAVAAATAAIALEARFHVRHLQASVPTATVVAAIITIAIHALQALIGEVHVA
jgi:hypothetical protein